MCADEAKGNDDEYRPLWQHWDLVRPEGTGAPASCLLLPSSRPASLDWRSRMQTARVERRMSISELAARVKCDASALAAFERGEEIMDASVQQRLKQALGV